MGFLLWIANKSSEKAYQELSNEYDEATKWYESLDDAKKAEIMDRFWYNHPTYHNGKRYMTSIYRNIARKPTSLDMG